MMKTGNQFCKTGFAILACCMMFTGCQSGGETEQTLATIQEETQTEQASQENVSVANPWKEVTEEELVKVTGKTFRLPAGAQNVHYRYMESDGLAEAVFEWEDLVLTTRRRQGSEFEDISGMYYDWVIQNDVKVGSFVGKESTAFAEQQTVRVCIWYDTEEEMVYSLSVIAANLDGFDILALAEEMAGVR